MIVSLKRATYLAVALLLSACTNTAQTESGDTLRLTVPGGKSVQGSPTPTSVADKSTPPSNPNNSKEETLVFTDQKIQLETNYGDMEVVLFDSVAPKTTESFIRLVYRGYYDGLIFHRMVKSSAMNIIQGGDPKGNGTGGASAFGKPFEDEIFKAGESKEFLDAALYPDYNGVTATYQKGYLAMANSGKNTNGSQFFIMLTDTKLPPNYTIFGQIVEEDQAILDKIMAEVEPTSPSGDGKPDKELKIVKATLIQNQTTSEIDEPAEE